MVAQCGAVWLSSPTPQQAGCLPLYSNYIYSCGLGSAQFNASLTQTSADVLPAQMTLVAGRLPGQLSDSGLNCT